MSYEKLGFESGQKLKADHLNHMEEGIANAYGSADCTLISILDTDPVEPKEGQIWILRATTKGITMPVIELGEVGENSIAIKLSNASFDENGAVVDSYNIYVNGVFNKTASIAAGSTCVVTGLSAETEYQISVRGVKGTVFSGASNTIIATTEEASVAEGEMAIVIGVTAGNADGEINLNTWTGNGRATAVYTAGKKACVNKLSDDVYYPIPVPADATSVTVVCPGMTFGYHGWNLASTNTYSYDVDSGWQNSGTIYTFEAGAAEYATIVFVKKSGDITDADIANITITFGTNSESDKQPMIILRGYAVKNLDNAVGTTIGLDVYRACTVAMAGKQPVPPVLNGVQYYMAEAPEGAVSCTVVCPGMMWGYNGWNTGSDGKLSYDVDSGWRDSGTTYTFAVGAAEYVSISFKRTDNGEVTDEDIAGINFTFKTIGDEVEPEIVTILGVSAGSHKDNINMNHRETGDRATSLYTVGEKPCTNSKDDGVYYPIPVPANATSVTIECPGLMYGYNGWNISNNIYSYDVDSGWKDSGTTYTFAAGAAKYATIGYKRIDNGEVTAEDVAGITITFA